MSGIHTPKPNPGSTHKPKRIGRGPGSGHGKTAGRGMNGMWSRAGTHSKRGFTNDPFRKEHTTLNIGDLERFAAGSKVGPDELIASGLVRKIAKHGLRILGDGNLDRALHITAHYFPASAKDKIVKAGGSAKVIVV